MCKQKMKKHNKNTLNLASCFSFSSVQIVVNQRQKMMAGPKAKYFVSLVTVMHFHSVTLMTKCLVEMETCFTSSTSFMSLPN